ncbi:hypothetical protein [Nonomuraea sp. bgisy101]|uniref:hypothetical protein n=1 Tax=Nonomuraea sp. bgisy101 TaxID=3413784 RepID=UPI003D723C18
MKLLPKTICFGANAEGVVVLAAMQKLPDVLAYRSRLTAPLIPGRLHRGSRGERPVEASGVRPPRPRSTRWRNPQARLLEGKAWEAVRVDVLTQTIRTRCWLTTRAPWTRPIGSQRAA